MAEKMDAGQTDDHKGETPRTSEEELDFSYTQNRELSWLRFNDRVLDEAFDETVPLFERLKFVSIFGSNLDEWFMIRIGGLSDLTLLKHQPKDNKSNETPAEQLQAIFAVLPDYVSKQQRALDQIESKLATRGLERLKIDDMSDADRSAANKFFLQQVAPIISPQIVDPRHPFPNLRNGRLYVTCSLNGPEETGMLGIVEVPSALPRVVELPAAKELWRYTLIEDVIRDHLSELFGEYVPTTSATIRITRNADIDPDGEGVGEEEDYRQHMKRVLKLRQRLQPVRLEVQGALPKELEKFVLAEIGLSKKRVFHVRMPLDLGYVYSLEEHLPADTRATLLYNPFQPQTSPMVDPRRPMREQVDAGDILLFYPYESMNPLLRLIHEASVDDNCIQIKITLYRVAKRSKLCESLIAASENGKDVTVLMELRARFDEQNNIDWAERLEDAGCTVIYGQEGFKVHSKICQIIYHDKGAISRITCLGTGNFNEKTAELYSDFMLLTAHPGIGEDGNLFFRNLSLGNLQGTYRYLGVAPTSLKPLVMSGLDREIEKARASKPASAFMKMNSLTDRDVIDKISEACEAGVHIVMIVRGICCIKAGVPGKTDGLIVRQIVGRFLEHARVYSFGVDADTIYLSSADMMTRNTERRVEIAYPVLDPTCRKLVTTYMDLQLADNVKARQLTAAGTWEKIPIKADEPRIDAQAQLEVRAYKRATEAADAQSASHKHRSPTSAERAAVHKAPSATRPKASSFPTSVPNSKATGVEAPRRGRLQRALGLIGEGFKMLFGGQ
ncbi:MAG: polyphosphate kinase 1 [Atopobiaceae bacterium]|jgi:polyphosphate kinase|nr:polyphosphate kinase 1 [Olegusella sp.]